MEGIIFVRGNSPRRRQGSPRGMPGDETGFLAPAAAVARAKRLQWLQLASIKHFRDSGTRKNNTENAENRYYIGRYEGKICNVISGDGTTR